MAIDQEVNKLSVGQATKRLNFIESMLPQDVFIKVQDSLQLRLVLNRVLFKARLVTNHLVQNYKLLQVSFNLVNDVELEHETEVNNSSLSLSLSLSLSTLLIYD